MDNQGRRRYISMQTSITAGMVVMGILISAAVSGLSYLNFSSQVREDIRLRLREIADITAVQLDPEELATVVDQTDVENDIYIKYQKRLSDIINASNDVINIYTMRRNSEGVIYFYMDAGRPDYMPDPPGVIPYMEPSDLLMAVFASPSGTVVEKEIYTDEFGSVISAYTPLYKRDGGLESILAVDMKADTVIAAEQNALQRILIYFAISNAFVFLLAWFLGYRLSRQTVALSTVASRIAHVAEKNLETIPVSLAGNNREAFDLIQVFNRMSGELLSLIQNLEERIAGRTADLETARQNSARRAHQFEAIAQVNRAVTSIQDLDTLLPRITQLISERFNVYHSAIFLLDENREFAVLRAANSEGGGRMLARGHKLEINQSGMIGFVIAAGQPRIALDTDGDPIYFDNPDLPETRSEIALPLRFADRVIGALDVQSTEPDAFRPDDLEALTALADQVSAAINNTLAFQNAQKALAESKKVLERNIQDAWKVMRPASLGTGFQLAGSKLTPLEKRIEGEHIRQAVSTGLPALSTDEDAPSSLAIPVRLRGQIIGVINLRARNRRLTKDDADIARAVTERLSLAIETATLLQSTQHRADIERVTTEISSKIGSSTQFETILQTAAQELSRALGGSDVLVQIEPDSMKMSST